MSCEGSSARMVVESPTLQRLHLYNRVHRRFFSQPVTYGVPWLPPCG